MSHAGHSQPAARAAGSTDLAREVFEAAHEAFVSMDSDGRVVAWNRAAENTFGWTSREATGRLVAELIIPERYRHAHWEGLQRFLQTGEGPVLDQRLELEAVHRDGYELPVEMTITAVQRGGEWSFHAFLHDISDRKRAERYLRAQYEVTAALAESADKAEALPRVLEALGSSLNWAAGGFWELDAEHRELVTTARWNCGDDRLQEFCDASQEFRFRPGIGLPGLVFEQGEPLWLPDLHAEPRFLRAQIAGEAGLQGSVALPIRSGSSSLGVLEFFSRDVMAVDPSMVDMLVNIGSQVGQFIERRRAERASDELKAQFAATVSHELRTPLTSIRGFASTMIDLWERLTDEQKLQQLNIIRDESERLSRIVEDVLTVSGVQSRGLRPRAERSRVGEIVAEILEQHPNIDAGFDGAPDVVACVDRDHLKQILLNLLTNATRYGRAPISVSAGSDGSTTSIRVSDQGDGVPEEFIPLLFERFTQARTDGRLNPGTGLGLAIVKGLSELNGGSVHYEPGTPRGATFVVELPA